MTLKRDPYLPQRQQMVDEQLVARGISDPTIIHAMLNIPRHLFVPAKLQREAYADKALPLGPGQTISQPFIVALMLSSLDLNKDQTILEVGSGSGYLACLASLLVKKVYGVELSQTLVESATDVAKKLELQNVEFICADGGYGYEDKGPYDRIVLSAACNEIPRPLLKQLAPDGKFIFPLTDPDGEQQLVLLSKEDDKLSEEVLGSVRFVEFQTS